ncbi:Gfo/Idh/MocA family protein [Pseudahrensia aquimaris]|uniref:Gfo/Idh/MocA family protein n=1 Tax=Pseudahrensia aquimaris TaxID=744461 RepID=A0ABW3FFW1_9HYPH
MARLNWGMIGGGEGSQIGPAHRISAGLDGKFNFAASALDIDAAKGKAFAQTLGIEGDRAYGDWREMLAGEKDRADRVDLVTIATPNSTHFEIAKAFTEEGFHVLCEKPMTMTVAEAEELVKLAEAKGTILAVNYGYSGYSLVRHMRAMVARGDLGKVRLIKAEFAHGFHADEADADNPRVRWRYDPDLAGVSAQFADCGIHALHMASYVSGQEAETLSADFASGIPSRTLEDDAMLNIKMSGGARCRLWTSSIAIGRMHGLNIQVFGERGGLRWAQEQPNQLFWTPLNGRTEIIERGAGNLSPEADRASRVTIGHAEGMPLAFANIYLDLAEAISAHKHGRTADSAATQYPKAIDGLRSMAAIVAAVDSAKQQGVWVDARPPMLR